MTRLTLRSTPGLVAATATAVIVGGSWAVATAVAERPAQSLAVPARAGVVAIETGGVPTDVEATPDAVWVSVGLGGLVRLDPRTNARMARIRPGGSVTLVASGFGAIWAIDLFGDRLLRVDPRTNRVVRSIAVGPLPSGLAIGHGLVWVASQLAATVAGIDPSTGMVVRLARFARGELWPGGLAVGPRGVWVITAAGSEVSLFDPETMTFRSRTSVAGARSIVASGSDAWVGLAGRSSLIRIRNGRVTRVESGVLSNGYGPVIASGRRVWVASGGDVAAIDSARGAVVERLRLPSPYAVVAIAADGAWAVDANQRAVLRLGRVARSRGVQDRGSRRTSRSAGFDPGRIVAARAVASPGRRRTQSLPARSKRRERRRT